jgi:hypothetical protein
MLRSIATVIFAICLTAWSGLALLLCITLFQYGLGAIPGKVAHVFGTTNQLTAPSMGLAMWRMVGLFVVTLLVAYIRRSRHSNVSEKGPTATQRE